MSEHIIIQGGKLILPEGVFGGDIEISGGRIATIQTNSPIHKTADVIINATGKYILPGFIDIHTNGIAGFDLTNGVFNLHKGDFISNEKVYMEGLTNALNQYAKNGVTSVYMTSLAAPLDQLKKVLGFVKKFKYSPKDNRTKDILKGLYIEGTFMKQAEYRGAHNPQYFYEPSVTLFNELQDASGGIIKIVNVVPEWGQPALDLIEYLTDSGIISAAGHTGATGYQYEDAISRGLVLAVHFLNGPTGSSGKTFQGGGAVETALRSDKMYLELIVDGYHVDKAYILDTIKRKGFEKVIPITDSMFAAEFPGLSDFEVFGIKGKVSQNGEYLQITDRKHALFGSKLIMPVAFSNLLNWFTTRNEGIWNRLHDPLNFEDALVKISGMMSGNSAKLLGLYDSGEATGSIEISKAADLIIANIDMNENGYELQIEKVLLQGKLVN